MEKNPEILEVEELNTTLCNHILTTTYINTYYYIHTY
jgi:hypothetical protein